MRKMADHKKKWRDRIFKRPVNTRKRGVGMAGFFSDMDESDFNEAPRKETPPIVVAPEVDEENNETIPEENGFSSDNSMEVPDDIMLDGPGMVSMADLSGDDYMNDPEDDMEGMPDDNEENASLEEDDESVEDTSPEENSGTSDTSVGDEDEDFGELIVKNTTKAAPPEKKTKNSKKEPVQETPAKQKEEPKAVEKGSDVSVKGTIITAGTVITGSIQSKENVLVEGIVEGHVEAKNIVIQNGGQVKEGAAAEENLEIHGNIDGDISGKNVRLCQSKIRGNITSKGRISVDKDSILNGDVTEGEDIDIYGRVRGMISVTGKATIHRGSIVKGSVRCHDIYLETGSRFQGSVEQVVAEDISDDLFE